MSNDMPQEVEVITNLKYRIYNNSMTMIWRLNQFRNRDDLAPSVNNATSSMFTSTSTKNVLNIVLEQPFRIVCYHYHDEADGKPGRRQ